MADTAFVNQATLTDQGWFNDVNSATYYGLQLLTSVGGTGDAITATIARPPVLSSIDKVQLQVRPPAINNTATPTIAISGGPAVWASAQPLYYQGVQALAGTYGPNDVITIQWNNSLIRWDIVSAPGTLVSKVSTIVPSITGATGLRQLSSTGVKSAYVLGYNAAADASAGGRYWPNPASTAGWYGNASIAGTTLTLNSTTNGAMAIGLLVSGTGIAAGTYVTAGSGNSWTVNISQTVASTTVVGDNGGSVIVALIDGMRWFLRTPQQEYTIMQFGGGLGLADDGPVYASALGALGLTGGTIRVGATVQSTVLTSFTLPVNCHIVGPQSFVGSTSNSGQYSQVGGAIRLASTATISMNIGSSIKGMLIYRNGMTFPAADSSLFAGTAITVQGDDCAVCASMILGFAKGIYSNNVGRGRFEYLFMDNSNGIEISAAADIPYINFCHCWPFATINNGGALTTNIRSGTAYYLHDLVDWGKITSSFSWGYLYGTHIFNANDCTLTSVGHDNAFSGSPLNPNSIGILIDGTSDRTKLIGTQTAAQATAGVYINTSAGNFTYVEGHTIWGGSQHGVFVNAGNAHIVGGGAFATTYGVSVNSAASTVFFDQMTFRGLVTNPLNPAVATTLIFIGENNDWNDFTGVIGSTNLMAQSIASAASITLPNRGKVFNITGTTNISTIVGGWTNREVTFVFAGVLTINSANSGSTSIRMQNNANFTTAAGGTVRAVNNGSQWYATSQLT